MEKWRFYERQRLSKRMNIVPDAKVIDRRNQEWSTSTRSVEEALKKPDEDVRVTAVGTLKDKVINGKIKLRPEQLRQINKHYESERSSEVKKQILLLNAHVGNIDFVNEKLVKEKDRNVVKSVLLQLGDAKHPEMNRIASHVINKRNEEDVIKTAVKSMRLVRGPHKPRFRVKQVIKPIP